jgi:hypothetical protein
LLKALAKKFDLFLPMPGDLTMGMHPGLPEDEDLQPKAYVPALMTITETEQGQRELDQMRRKQESKRRAPRILRTKSAWNESSASRQLIRPRPLRMHRR